MPQEKLILVVKYFIWIYNITVPFDATYFEDKNNCIKENTINLNPRKTKKTLKDNKKNNFLKEKSIKLYDLIAIKFPSEGGILSGFITIEYIYNPQTVTINYSNIKYSDKRMEIYLEKNPNVIKNIDSYLKNKMLESEFELT